MSMKFLSKLLLPAGRKTLVQMFSFAACDDDVVALLFLLFDNWCLARVAEVMWRAALFEEVDGVVIAGRL